MKKPGADVAHLTPDASGWRLLVGAKTQTLATLEEAAAALPAKAAVHLAIPAPMALMERLSLPSTDREELAGMVQLQLEKTLPYPVEEVASDFEVIETGESESTVLFTAVHIPGLEQLCEPLRSKQRLPAKVTVYAQHIADACPPEETVLAIWSEQEHMVLAICEKARLSWLHSLTGTTAETLHDDLTRAMLGAELEGVSVNCTQIFISPDLSEFQPIIRDTLELPVQFFPADAALREPPTNLVPPSWHAEVRQFERSETLKQRLTLAAMVYLVLLAGAFVYLAWTKRQVQAMDAQIATLQPQLKAVQAMEARWKLFRPALDPSLSTVEVLFQINKNRPPETKITIFDYSLSGQSNWQFTVDGEGPAENVIDYAIRLQKEPELSAFQIESPAQPRLLPNGGAQFRITGRL